VSAPGRRRARIASGVAGLLAFALGIARAATPVHADDVGARFGLDNDQFNFWEKPADRPDFGYTHGTEISLHFPDAPRALARLAPAWLIGRGRAGESAPSLEVTVRQSIYSPWSNPPDEPYAGWLEAAIGVSRAIAEERRTLLLHAGVTGPPSLAGRVQRYFHRRFDHGDPPPDWSHQLPFEPGLGLEAGGEWIAAASGPAAGWRLAAGPLARLRAGTYAVDLRLGMNVSLGRATPMPWPAGRPASGPALYVRARPKLDVVARDEFLDGTLFRASRGFPGAQALVPESEFVFGAGWSHARLEYAVIRRGKEFDGQPTPHTYSSCTFAWLP
jgi:hypothetical protein